MRSSLYNDERIAVFKYLMYFLMKIERYTVNSTVSAEQFARSSVKPKSRKAFNVYKRGKKKWKQSIY